MKLSWIPPAVIVVCCGYFVYTNIPYEVMDYGLVNSPMDLRILMLVSMIMIFIIVLMPTENKVC